MLTVLGPFGQRRWFRRFTGFSARIWCLWFRGHLGSVSGFVVSRVSVLEFGAYRLGAIWFLFHYLLLMWIPFGDNLGSIWVSFRYNFAPQGTILASF